MQRICRSRFRLARSKTCALLCAALSCCLNKAPTQGATRCMRTAVRLTAEARLRRLAQRTGTAQRCTLGAMVPHVCEADSVLDVAGCCTATSARIDGCTVRCANQLPTSAARSWFSGHAAYPVPTPERCDAARCPQEPSAAFISHSIAAAARCFGNGCTMPGLHAALARCAALALPALWPAVHTPRKGKSDA